MELSAQKLKQLESQAQAVRKEVVSMIEKAGSGHPAGSLGMADIFVSLYFGILNHDSQKPHWPDRDRLVLSYGHICPVLYATLAQVGYFPKEELNSLRKLGSRLQGHPSRESLLGIETTSGPLGCGLSQAVGMAWAAKLDKKKWRTVCLISDAEHDEGNIWEAVMLAAKYHLDNITALVDCNGIQASGSTDEVMALGSLKDKYQAFGWEVLEIDGHQFTEIFTAFEKAASIKDKPTAIIAKIIPGKGVSFMEGKFQWHSRVPSKEEAKKALKELSNL